MQDGDTALIKASGEGHTDTVKELLRAQVNVNIQNQVSCSTVCAIPVTAMK